MVEESLARWLHAVELVPGSERQQAIASAAKSYASSPKASDPRDMVPLAHRVPDAVSAYETLFAAMTAADSTFGCAIGELETRLIAGAFVAAIMERNAAAASTAAYLVLNAGAIGLTSEVADLPTLATESLARRAEAVRSRRQIQSTVDISIDAVPAFEEDGNPATHEEVRLLRDASVASFEATAKSVESLVNQVSARLRASDEELDLLWWCVSGRSERLGGVDWTSVNDVGLASIAAAFEMSDLLVFTPHPPSAELLLARILGPHSNKKVSLQGAVNAARKSDFSVELEGHQLLPVLSSLREHAELGGDQAWKASVKRWSIDPSRNWTGLELAAECLRELMILKQVS